MALTFYHCIHILPYISCFLYIIHRLKRMKTAYICLIHLHIISSCTEQEGLQGDEFSISGRSVAVDSNFTTAWTRHQSGGPQIILQLLGYITDTRIIGQGSQEHCARLRQNIATKTGQGWKTFSAKGQKVNILGIVSMATTHLSCFLMTAAWGNIQANRRGCLPAAPTLQNRW